MKVNKDSFTGMVTYELPNGKTFKVPYKNRNYCVAADGTKYILLTMVRHTYICMIIQKDIMTIIVLKMISAPMWLLGKSKKNI